VDVFKGEQSSFSRRTLLRVGAATLGATLIPKFSLQAEERHGIGNGITASGGIVSRWETDPWARGSYSALPPGINPIVRQVIAKADVAQRIVFAGEYCDPAFPATMQGALRSGTYAAKHVEEVARGVTGKSVIVVGAGLAGLAAASKLQKLGASVRILEARNRTGGRIKTDYSLGIPLELGPSWIHARKGNPLEPLLARAGLTTVKASYKTRARNIVNGKQDLLANKELRELQSVLEDPNNTWPKTSLSMAAWLGQNSWSGKSEMQRWASDVELTQDFGLPDSNFGVKAYFEGRDHLGGDGLIAGGLNNLTDMLAKNLDIELNRPVVSVSPTGSGARVELQSGEALSCDLVVIAVPVSLLQAGLPQVLGLAPKVQLAIDSLETGNLEKVALVFSQSWWVRPETKVPVLGVTGDKRWSAFYDMSEVVGAPTLFGLTGGQRSTTRPKNDQACLREAQDAVVSAWRPHRE